MSSNIRVGVIGAGNISGAHLPVLSALDGIALTCICDIRPERAKAAAEKYGCEYTTDWEALVAREDIDSVHVLTPHYLHARMAIACLEAGKHALTEKPMASELADARRMIAVSREHPELKLGVIFQNRYNPATVELKKIIDSGEQGAFLGARAEVTWRREAPYYQESGWRRLGHGRRRSADQPGHPHAGSALLPGRPHRPREGPCGHHRIAGRN